MLAYIKYGYKCIFRPTIRPLAMLLIRQHERLEEPLSICDKYKNFDPFYFMNMIINSNFDNRN